MRTGHGSEKQFVERVKPVILFLWGCKCTDWAKQSHGVSPVSPKQGDTGGWPGKPSVVERSTKACFLRRKGDAGLGRKAEDQGKHADVFNVPWQASRLHFSCSQMVNGFSTEGRVFSIRPKKSRPQLPRWWLWNTVEPPQAVKWGLKSLESQASPLQSCRPPPSPSFSLCAVIWKRMKSTW